MKTNLDNYFSGFDNSVDDLSVGGHIYANISLFNHWLSEKEFPETQVLSYAIAVEAGVLDEYVDGENKFLAFYTALAKDGIIINWPRPLRMIEANELELENIFIESLREHKFMDVYFISARVRVIGGWDRTDLVLFESPTDMTNFKLEVERAGLFLLTDNRSCIIH
jgi:hypothetical protein